MYRQSLLLTLLLAVVTACAEVEVRPLKPEERIVNGVPGNDYLKTKGVRFFRPWPYLWITVGEQGMCEMSITYLPQMEQEYIIIPNTGIGSVTMNPVLTNGWSLTSLNATADSKASEMVTAIGNLTGNAAKAAVGGAGFVGNKEFGPGLYRILFDQSGYVFDLEHIILQKGPGPAPVKCQDVKPPK